MKRSFVGLVIAVLASRLIGAPEAGAQSVKITPLGSHDGEFCAADRALIFEDPDGTRLLYDAGRTVRGPDDPRLGKIDAVLLSHVHGDHLGDAYQSAGLGIGLALARRLVELHGGRLDARSEGHGRGSEFVIQVPLATNQVISAIERRADEQRLDRRILVVDDNQDAANATAMLIAELGGDARVAHDGESTLAMLKEYRPEVILLDIGMRGLDGYETCQRIRGVLGSGVLLVALTGFGQEQDKEKATRAGFDAHLTKPADEKALTGMLTRS